MLIAAALVFGSLAGIAVAAPHKLSDSQMDKVAAGALPVGQPPTFGHFPHPGWPVGGPPVINPGGPILISCIVGSGCTTRRVP
jgi:hypothetical protein